MIFELCDDPYLFPDPHYGEDDGLLAVGGDLSFTRLVAAYSHGIFPWYDFRENDEILWWCPLQRFVIFPSEIHISHSMRQLMRKRTYNVTFNKAFDAVIQGCSRVDSRYHQKGAWLGEDIIDAFKMLHHEFEFAESVEVWSKTLPTVNETKTEDLEFHYDEEYGYLVGGLYGMRIGHNFLGDSMFSLVPSASKLALIALAQRMLPDGGLIDCQLETPHLKSMGGRTIPYEEFMLYLRGEK